MGWLFAVARGLQEGSRGAVLASLVPIVIGHEASIVVVVGVTVAAQELVAPHTVRLLAALALVSFGVYRVARPRSHPRMRVGSVSLAAWSFLMSSAHGAGLMIVPVLLGWPVVQWLPAANQMGALVLVSTIVHVTAMLIVMAGAGRLPGSGSPHPAAQLVQPGPGLGGLTRDGGPDNYLQLV